MTKFANLKKIIILFLFISHLFSTIGLSINIHDCGGDKSYTLFEIPLNHNCCCNHSESKHKDNCCKDKKVNVKAKDIVKSLKKDISIKKNNLVVSILQTVYIAQNTDKPAQTQSQLIQTEFPPSHAPPLFILFQVFRI